MYWLYGNRMANVHILIKKSSDSLGKGVTWAVIGKSQLGYPTLPLYKIPELQTPKNHWIHPSWQCIKWGEFPEGNNGYCSTIYTNVKQPRRKPREYSHFRCCVPHAEGGVLWDFPPYKLECPPTKLANSITLSHPTAWDPTPRVLTIIMYENWASCKTCLLLEKV